MLSALHGRINRRTYVIGNIVALGILLCFIALIFIPLAIIEIAVNNSKANSVLDLFFYIAAFPALLYYFFFVTLMVKRAHDVGWPGFFIAVGFTLAVILGQVLNFFPLNVLALFIFLFFCIKPGQKTRNNFGTAPLAKFKFNDLKVNFKDY